MDEEQIRKGMEVIANAGITVEEAYNALTQPEVLEAFDRAWIYGLLHGYLHADRERAELCRQLIEEWVEDRSE